ncbi:golgin subfamily A member 4 isoform X2 [Cherax quadricarinatus]|uniref:golgin subfamily A member 4 isoform X2 n=1 Tax=Cherax quadricarinatus TaxID=27406 RepID=UPI00387ECB81
MLRKLREKITEEVQQTSLRLPASVQQSVQQLTQLSPFSGTGTSPGEHRKNTDTPSLQDQLLVDISDIRPAGHNKDLFSIDEDSHEGSPSKSGFQLVDLSDAESGMTPTTTTTSDPPGEGGVAGVTFDPTLAVTPSLTTPRVRRDSAVSDVSSSDVSTALFPIYEVPGVYFSIPQSDLESSSEWEDSNSNNTVTTTTVERLSKDTVYQAYLKMRQRYHKYKGRYSDLARAYKEKEKESEKLRDVLTKTQDKALRKVSELREQCSLEQQAKAHLEQELRSDLEEKDHKITALLTKVKILQEGITGDLNSVAGVVSSNNNIQLTVASPDDHLGDGDSVSAGDASSGADNVSTAESVSTADVSMADNVSVASHGSASTSVTVNIEAEEMIEKLKGDVAKHKSLLARCMDNIRGNKERIALLTQERDLATTQLHDKLKLIDLIKEDHVRELESLRTSMESSALSMAETKKQLFEELQAKEAEAERCKQATTTLERQLDEERDRWHHELHSMQQELHSTQQELQATQQELQANQQELLGKEQELHTLQQELQANQQELHTVQQELQVRQQELEEKDAGVQVNILPQLCCKEMELPSPSLDQT